MANEQNFRVFCVGNAKGVLIEGTVHVLKRSKSRYHLCGSSWYGWPRQYCCQDQCCDNGIATDVSDVVALARAAGATKVVLRIGWASRIHDLPISDVTKHVGEIAEGWKIQAVG